MEPKKHNYINYINYNWVKKLISKILNHVFFVVINQKRNYIHLQDYRNIHSNYNKTTIKTILLSYYTHTYAFLQLCNFVGGHGTGLINKK